MTIKNKSQTKQIIENKGIQFSHEMENIQNLKEKILEIVTNTSQRFKNFHENAIEGVSFAQLELSLANDINKILQLYKQIVILKIKE